ncbi:hypothetical protein M2368_003471 [Arthrobacter sp. JUb119]|uniref:hypothetical protein n=1 Tax=Arthrobacter sp. JUb115 TaxID=2485108 RepID=UPI00105D8CAA|nr:hypothetical protein [Arthrobacter sp. JUb115]MCS3494439.1 hypothetical protein [Arthrobacter sp. JUb119]
MKNQRKLPENHQFQPWPTQNSKAPWRGTNKFSPTVTGFHPERGYPLMEGVVCVSQGGTSPLVQGSKIEVNDEIS